MKYLITFLALTFSTQLATQKSPNFILIYADYLGYADTLVQMMDADPSTQVN